MCSPELSSSNRGQAARPAELVGARSYGRRVNRTDRLYALVEELRACAPRRRSARELALLYEVSARTIERDIGALQQAGVPIYADAGRFGGYTVYKSLTLPPLNFTPAEAVAIAVALAQVNVGPFEDAARSAVQKIVAAISERDVEPVVFMAGPSGWYLVGWCRVRNAARCFRVDRIQPAEVTGVTAPPRAFEDVAPCIPDLVARTPVL